MGHGKARMKLRRDAANRTILPLALILIVALSFIAAYRKTAFRAFAQSEATHAVNSVSENEKIDRAMSAICRQREQDALGSLPIDEMQARAQVASDDPSVSKAAERARRLLPIARTFALRALRQLARDYDPDFKQSRTAASRLEVVDEIEPDATLRDNALVIPDEPRKIYFGTIFLIGLQSDEAVISVLAHELTHIGASEDGNLRPLFQAVANRAASLTSLEITDERAEELTCDLVGAMAARFFVDAMPNKEPLARRVARSVEHNCVADDDTDEAHLSPRNTMRAVLALDAALARDVVASHESRSLQRTHHR